jgi:hypothetical protein
MIRRKPRHAFIAMEVKMGVTLTILGFVWLALVMVMLFSSILGSPEDANKYFPD